MKINFFKMFLFAVIFVTLQSCEKKMGINENNGIDNTSTNVHENITEITDVIYYLDNSKVSENVFDNYKKSIDEPYIIRSIIKDSKNGGFVDVFYAFSSKDRYIEYGDKNGLNLKGQLEFESHMRKYAKESGAIDEFEKTGKVPESYLIYEEKYHTKIFGKKREEKNISFFLYDHCNGGAYIALLPHHSFPFLPKSWRNRISFVENVGLVGLISFYDKSFYRSRLETVNLYVTNWYYCFSGTPTDNRAESVHAW